MSSSISLSSFSSSSSRHKPRAKSASDIIFSSGRGGSGNIRPLLSKPRSLQPPSPALSARSLPSFDVSSVITDTTSLFSSGSSLSSTPGISRSPSPALTYATSITSSLNTTISFNKDALRSVRSLTSISYVYTYEEQLSITPGRERVVVIKDDRCSVDNGQTSPSSSSPTKKSKGLRTGRGGAGTMKREDKIDAKILPGTAESIEIFKSKQKIMEKTLIEMSIDAYNAFGSSGRGGSGNIGPFSPGLIAIQKAKKRRRWPRLRRRITGESAGAGDEIATSSVALVESDDNNGAGRVIQIVVDPPEEEEERPQRVDVVVEDEAVRETTSSIPSLGPSPIPTSSSEKKPKNLPLARLPPSLPLPPVPVPANDTNELESTPAIPTPSKTRRRSRIVKQPKTASTLPTTKRKSITVGKVSKTRRRQSLIAKSNLMTVVHGVVPQILDLNTEDRYFSDEDEWEGDVDAFSDDDYDDEEVNGMRSRREAVRSSVSSAFGALDLHELHVALEEDEGVVL